MNYFYIVIFQLTYIIPSLLLYIMIFFYICWSGDPEFHSAFHRIFIARAPADIIQVTTSLIAFRFPLAGWEGCLRIAHLAKFGFVVSQYSCLLELCAQFLLSANRFSAISLPLSHNKIWSTRRTYGFFVICAVLSLIPTVLRIPQPSAYLNVSGAYVAHLIDPHDQTQNSIVSCCIYISVCALSLIFNVLAIYSHSKQRKLLFFESQPKLAAKVQTNLLIYSCIFTFVVCAMTVFQCLLAVHIFPLKSDSHSLVIVFLTISADMFALSNPWLLLLLSNTFREKFLEARRIRKIFASSSTIGTD